MLVLVFRFVVLLHNTMSDYCHRPKLKWNKPTHLCPFIFQHSVFLVMLYS